jgi:Fe-S cluster biogenesis protein NfuA
MVAEFNSSQAAVQAVLNTLRPAMEADGGGVELIAVECGRVDVQLKGMCLDCPSAGLTLRLGIERTLKEQLPWVIEVRRVG